MVYKRLKGDRAVAFNYTAFLLLNENLDSVPFLSLMKFG